MSLEDLSYIATIAGAGLGVVALFLTYNELRIATNISKAEFHLDLERMFKEHDKVHLKLRPGGLWHRPKSGPDGPDEWIEVEDYMGLFEHAEMLLRSNLIDWETFKAIFGYRVKNILNNDRIVETKLRAEGASWTVFSAHVRRYGNDSWTKLLPSGDS